MRRNRKYLLGILMAAVLAATACTNPGTGSGGQGAGNGQQSGVQNGSGEEGKEAEEKEDAREPGTLESAGEAGTPDPAGEEELAVGVFEDPGMLNPYTGESPEWALDWVYQGLVSMEDGVPVPELAERWEISEDGLACTFYLRPDLRSSDGGEFTAETAKKNMDMVLSHKEYYPYLPSVAMISSVEAADSGTLKISLTSPSASLLNDLAVSYPFGMMGEAGFTAEGDLYSGAGAAETGEENSFSTAGTGMWTLKTYVAGEYSLFERNENYWGEKPGFRYLKAVVFAEEEEAVRAMEDGEIDVIVDTDRLSPDLFFEMKEAGFQTAVSPSSRISVLNLNTAGPVTGDKNVRLAMEYATDTGEISETVYGGLQEPAYSYFSLDVPGTDVGIRPYETDTARADEILEAAGWTYAEGESVRSKDGQKLEIRLVYDASIAGNALLGETLKAQYGRVGIQVNLEPMDSAACNEAWQSGQFDALVSRTWGIPYEPYGTFFCMASPGDKFHLVQSKMEGKDGLDVILRDSLSQKNETRMRENMAYIMESFHNEAVYVPLTEVSSLAIYREGLMGPDLDSARGGLGLHAMKPEE